MLSDLNVCDLGLIRYEDAFRLQRVGVEKVVAGSCPVLFLCEHPAVLTLGRSTREGHILVSANELEKRGIHRLKADRGGDVTLHAPGQLVAYPIVDLNIVGRDLRAYLYKLEQVAIDFLSEFAIVTRRQKGRTGVWCGSQKIVSIGIGVRKWVAYHGLGINVKTDLSLFSMIKPCGLDVEMTSLEAQLGAKVDLTNAKRRLVSAFCAVFNVHARAGDPDKVCEAMIHND